MVNPSASLVGCTLNETWYVEKLLIPNSTNSNFSYGYLVNNIKDDTTAFCKAIDLGHVLGKDDVMARLLDISESYEYEKSLVIRCTNNKLKRVLKVLDHGEVRVPKAPFPPVPFLVFEKAESDVQVLYDISESFDTAWKLRSLHHIAVGLSELHFNDIFHLDLKPSNIFNMGDRETKIGDLGRSLDCSLSKHPAYSDKVNCGAEYIAPPEILYNLYDDDVDTARRAIELYTLGSMAIFYFYGLGLTQSILFKMPKEALPLSGMSVSAEDALVQWHKYWNEVLIEIEFYNEELPESLHKLFFRCVRELTHPNYLKRGRKGLVGNKLMQYSVQPFVGAFNTLASRAEYMLMEK